MHLTAISREGNRTNTHSRYSSCLTFQASTKIATIEELRAKIVRLQRLLNTVTDQQAHKAITDLITEAERDIKQVEADAQGDVDPKLLYPPGS